MKTNFISLYLPEFTKTGKKTKFISIGFGKGEEELYKKLKSISTSEIKKILNIHNYNALVSLAETHFIKPRSYIKQVLQRHFREDKKTSPSLSPTNKYDRWIKLLEKDHPRDRRYQPLIKHLKSERRNLPL